MNIIYSAVFSSYDTVQPISLPQGWCALLFTDSTVSVKGWEIVPTKATAKIFRKIKICPHLFLPPHDISIWIDGNIVPQMPLNHLIKNRIGYHVMDHPIRKSVWAEAQRCIELRKDDQKTIEKQVRKYRSDGYKDDNGMVATGVLIRTPGHEAFGDAWWEEVNIHSVRDQISFPVIAQKHKLNFKKFPFLQGFKRLVHTGKR